MIYLNNICIWLCYTQRAVERKHVPGFLLTSHYIITVSLSQVYKKLQNVLLCYVNKQKICVPDNKLFLCYIAHINSFITHNIKVWFWWLVITTTIQSIRIFFFFIRRCSQTFVETSSPIWCDNSIATNISTST